MMVCSIEVFHPAAAVPTNDLTIAFGDLLRAVFWQTDSLVSDGTATVQPLTF